MGKIATNKKGVISLSGGLDSTSLALFMLSCGYEVRAYGFDYGQKHSIELERVKQNVKLLQDKGLPITFQVIDLKGVFNESTSSLKEGNGDIPQGHYADENMKSTVVENRNIIFSSILYGKALAWANQTQSHVDITLGLHAGDHTIYPDCRPESYEMAQKLFKISNWGSERVDYLAPFIDMNKSMVLGAGLCACEELELDYKEIYANTISCYDPDEEGRSCGKCGTCVERKEAFAGNGLEDPLIYQS
jgi:7-cyano-7-deazaguanine synthase